MFQSSSSEGRGPGFLDREPSVQDGEREEDEPVSVVRE